MVSFAVTPKVMTVYLKLHALGIDPSCTQKRTKLVRSCAFYIILLKSLQV